VVGPLLVADVPVVALVVLLVAALVVVVWPVVLLVGPLEVPDVPEVFVVVDAPCVPAVVLPVLVADVCPELELVPDVPLALDFPDDDVQPRASKGIRSDRRAARVEVARREVGIPRG
jgi:hypothetical protein